MGRFTSAASHPHALDQRAALDAPARVGEGQAIQNAKAFSGHATRRESPGRWATNAVPGAGMASSSRALSRAAAGVPVNTRTSSNASCGRCRAHPNARQKCLQPRLSTPSCSRQASSTVHGEVNREFGLGDLGLRSEKRIVERDIVRDQSAPAQHVGNLTGDIGELWPGHRAWRRSGRAHGVGPGPPWDLAG